MKYWSLQKSDPHYSSFLRMRTDILYLKGYLVTFSDFLWYYEFGSWDGFSV